MTTKSDLRHEVGQLLIMGFDGTEVGSGLKALLRVYQPGGVILFARNITGARQTYDLLHECHRLVHTPMFQCVDMEGGTVDRLKAVIAPAPAVATVAASGNRGVFHLHGRLIGTVCRALGFNTDFAPVLDLRLKPSHNVLGSRTASADPKETVVYAREFLAGLKEAKVLGCGKHFPGLGEANLDTHKELPAIHKPLKKMLEEDLYPYRILRKELPFVMVAHAAYPEVTKDKTPASLSYKWITAILRQKLEYRGLVISDDLEMGGVLAAAPIEDAAVQTIRAGADIFLVCHNEDHVHRAFEAVLKTAERETSFAKRVREAAKRVLAFKRKAKELHQRAVAPPRDQTVAGLRIALQRFAEHIPDKTTATQA